MCILIIFSAYMFLRTTFFGYEYIYIAIARDLYYLTVNKHVCTSICHICILYTFYLKCVYVYENCILCDLLSAVFPYLFVNFLINKYIYTKYFVFIIL